MNILLSNDDGIGAEGLKTLAATLATLGTLTVVAPDRNRSGASNSLTLESPLRVVETAPRWYSVNGTPTDCVHLAISGFLEEPQDLVVAGVNDGGNLGDDVLYSGTVAAAMEARFLGLPTLAVSLVARDGRHFATAARVALGIIEQLQRRPLAQALILNVNVPDLPFEALRGIRATRLGFRHRAERIVRAEDPRGRPVYWVGPAGEGADAGPGTDFAAVADAYVSVTPLSIDLTRHASLDSLGQWLSATPA